jgi:hypothetical protein
MRILEVRNNYLQWQFMKIISLYIYIKEKHRKIWYNKFMDEKRKLKVLDRIDLVLDKIVEEQSKPKVLHPNQTNPIYKNLANFSNAKIGDKWSVRDLLR